MLICIYLLFIDKCCPQKVVGGIDYKHVGEIHDPNYYGCSNGCVYERLYGNQNSQFCFRPGKLISECGSFPSVTSITELLNCPMSGKQFALLDGVGGGFFGGTAYTWEQCGNLCYLDSYCFAWQWTPETSCWLWTENASSLHVENSTDVISGYRECPGEYLSVIIPYLI